ncbi:MAG: YiiX/YebB-like N1pC/P60 family cysteine hydrolase [Bdellovibrionota bacterium]
MNRTAFSHMLVLWTLSSTVAFAGIRDALKGSVDALSSQNCETPSKNISQVLNALQPDDYKKELKEKSHDTLLNELFDFKLTIHSKLRLFYKEGNLSRPCGDAIRGTLWSIRSAEDIIHDDLYRNYKDSIKFPDNTFAPGNVHVRKNPKFTQVDLKAELKSGDIILSRGNAYTSAAISNLGEFDTQFSHLSIVYRDPTGELWTVEAHIEVGSFVRPLQDHIDDHNFRAMIYRFDNEETAAKAAEYIFKKVKKASDTTGNILYDFGFDMEESKQLFCSEVASHAFNVATDNKVQIPLFRSSLIKRKVDFVRLLELKPDTSFIPADIEVDPRFTIVSEWRDAAKVKDNLEKDAILQSMFRWHDEHNYRLVQASSKDSLIYRNVAWPLRRVPFLKKYFVDKLPLNMSRKLIGYFGVLNAVGELLQKKLTVADDKAIAERGLPLFKSEKYEYLDSVRVEDLAGKKKMHKMYRPKKQ